MYYLNWISKFNWIQLRTNWSFPGDWSSCIVKPRQTAFTITQSDLLALIKDSTTLICKSIQDVQLSHSPHVFLLLNLHCQCLSPSPVCPKDNTAVPRFSYCMGLSQANSIGPPLSSAKQAHISLLKQGGPSTENDSTSISSSWDPPLSRKWHFLVSAVTTEGFFSRNSASFPQSKRDLSSQPANFCFIFDYSIKNYIHKRPGK